MVTITTAKMVGRGTRVSPSIVGEHHQYSFYSDIYKCARDYEGIAWAQYDIRKAKCQRNDLCWSHIDQTMYTVYFNSRNRRCMHGVCPLLVRYSCTRQISALKCKISGFGRHSRLDRAETFVRFETQVFSLRKSRESLRGGPLKYCWSFKAGAKCNHR